MAKSGRPRLTPEVLQARIAEYCDRYGVVPNDQGMPPFPTGRRETRQHRDWIAVYKAHNRLGRRQRGQCERCSAPASDGSVFCEAHRAGKDGASTDERRVALEAQEGRCPVCGRQLSIADSVEHAGSGGLRSLLHPACHRLVTLALALGPTGVDGLRSYLWPGGSARARSRL